MGHICTCKIDKQKVYSITTLNQHCSNSWMWFILDIQNARLFITFVI